MDCVAHRAGGALAVVVGRHAVHGRAAADLAMLDAAGGEHAAQCSAQVFSERLKAQRCVASFRALRASRHTPPGNPIMSFVFAPPATPSVPVQGGAATALFPVHRIYCVGRNYVDHAIEMGHSGREAPFFFMKPADAVLPVAEGTVGQMHYPTVAYDDEVGLAIAVDIVDGH